METAWGVENWKADCILPAKEQKNLSEKISAKMQTTFMSPHCRVGQSVTRECLWPGSCLPITLTWPMNV